MANLGSHHQERVRLVPQALTGNTTKKEKQEWAGMLTRESTARIKVHLWYGLFLSWKTGSHKQRRASADRAPSDVAVGLKVRAFTGSPRKKTRGNKKEP